MPELGGFGMFSSGTGGSNTPSASMSYGVASGTDTYSVTLSPAITSYNTGLFISVKFSNANTLTTPTLNCNSLGPKTIVSNDGALYGGEIEVSSVYNLLYDGTNFVIIDRTILTYSRNLDSNTTSGNIVTGTTNNTISYSKLIPKNAVPVGTVLNIVFNTTFTGTTGGKTIRTYLNTSASLSGANLMSTYAAGNTTLYVSSSRQIGVKSSTVTEVLTAALSSPSGSAISTSAPTQYNINWAVDQYFIVAIQLANDTDTGVLSFDKINT